MGLESAAAVLEGLIQAGRSPETPAVAVASATRPAERVVTGTLATLANAVRGAGLESPVTLVVGEVARRVQEQTSRESPGESLGVVEVA
jgi:siroheme synthase